MNNAYLKLSNIDKSINGNLILSDISFSINSNEIVGLLGPNGAGKTTAFYIAAGLVFSEKGKVFIRDKDVSKDAMHIRARHGLVYLPQEASLFLDLTVEQNLMGMSELISGSSDYTNFVKEIIDDFSLNTILGLKGRMLSGGQRRKVEIARTMISQPSILLLDEPFAGIDPIAVEEIKELLVAISKKDMALLITDHNVRETLSLCDRALILNNGKIIAEGTQEELTQNSTVKESYFGEMFS